MGSILSTLQPRVGIAPDTTKGPPANSNGPEDQLDVDTGSKDAGNPGETVLHRSSLSYHSTPVNLTSPEVIIPDEDFPRQSAETMLGMEPKTKKTGDDTCKFLADPDNLVRCGLSDAETGCPICRGINKLVTEQMFQYNQVCDDEIKALKEHYAEVMGQKKKKYVEGVARMRNEFLGELNKVKEVHKKEMEEQQQAYDLKAAEVEADFENRLSMREERARKEHERKADNAKIAQLQEQLRISQNEDNELKKRVEERAKVLKDLKAQLARKRMEEGSEYLVPPDRQTKKKSNTK
ncbi:hypothetical protein K505DRAFT_376724 [Melanomma pulvis-pyrius CBS 109.77]|uniref:Uncharacterized protein n=1 Tax=Melanomma pulvis-pyrius CBS 109.77 TaxID=1314802 RepID=A0A6A6X5I9_9PLEO|nr:hypothetical protein K505DRAFT_376724 [Melanomma pulvis-pyrius CBS 109.77]